ncbi:MAG: bis(5'-nucleosyl)-tetraphosphatase [Candidatus Anstonellaceae archaeon]
MEQSRGFILFRKEGENYYFLLLHYKAGHWDFPRGHIEEGEDDFSTAIRELKEETGIDEIDLIEGFSYSYSYLFSNNKKQKQVNLMLARTNQKTVKLSSEHIGARWLNYQNALNLLTYENPKIALQQAKKFLENKQI